MEKQLRCEMGLFFFIEKPLLISTKKIKKTKSIFRKKKVTLHFDK